MRRQMGIWMKIRVTFQGPTRRGLTLFQGNVKVTVSLEIAGIRWAFYTCASYSDPSHHISVVQLSHAANMPDHSANMLLECRLTDASWWAFALRGTVSLFGAAILLAICLLDRARIGFRGCVEKCT